MIPFIEGGENKVPFKAWYNQQLLFTIMYTNIYPYSCIIQYRFPFSLQPRLNYVAVYFYQVFGILTSASCNVATDTLSAAMLVHANAHILRLGSIISKVDKH